MERQNKLKEGFFIEIKNRLSNFKRISFIEDGSTKRDDELFMKDKKRLSLYVNIKLKSKDPNVSYISTRKLLLSAYVLYVLKIKSSFLKE